VIRLQYLEQTAEPWTSATTLDERCDNILLPKAFGYPDLRTHQDLRSMSTDLESRMMVTPIFFRNNIGDGRNFESF